MSRFVGHIADCDLVIAVGALIYFEMFKNKKSNAGSVAASEVDLISQWLMGPEVDARVASHPSSFNRTKSITGRLVKWSSARTSKHGLFLSNSRANNKVCAPVTGPDATFSPGRETSR